MRTTLEYGAQLDTLNEAEMRQLLREAAEEWTRETARGIKYMRFGPAAATIVSAAFSFDGSGGEQNAPLGPRGGFVWSIRRLLVTGLGTGATPDVINFYRNSITSGIPVWQLNGNSFGQTFGKIEFMLLDGETLSFANLGTVAATGSVTVSGDVLEVPAEQIAKLVGG